MTHQDDRDPSADFVSAVRARLRPIEGRPNYDASLQCHLDTTRFDVLLREVSAYRPVSGARLLSSGCGSAGDLWAALRAGAVAVCGAEIDAGLVDLARLRFSGAPGAERVDVRLYDGETLPFADRAFDVVLSIHVIEHTRQPERYLGELLRVTAPGGCVVLDLPNRAYAFEQHSWVPLIHYLPERMCHAVVRAATGARLRALVPDDLRYAVSAVAGLRLVSAGRLLRLANSLRQRWPLTVADAFFHSYDGARVPFTGSGLARFFGRRRRRTTFRLVLRRAGCGS